MSSARLALWPDPRISEWILAGAHVLEPALGKVASGSKIKLLNPELRPLSGSSGRLKK